MSRNSSEYSYSYDNFIKPEDEPSVKRRKCSTSVLESSGRHSQAPNACKDVSSKKPNTETDNVFMSKEEIEKNGIDAMHEAHLRYSYCDFLQNLGIHLDLPYTSYRNCHGFMSPLLYVFIAIASLFLAAKSKETARPLNNVPRASCEIFHKQDLVVLSYFLLMVRISNLSFGIIDCSNILHMARL
ncbi:hypothetical protein BC332_07423 [Capsicum chinense]|nr:hypothetical protein BC332_07423 [Capsicum chinense]